MSVPQVHVRMEGSAVTCTTRTLADARRGGQEVTVQWTLTSVGLCRASMAAAVPTLWRAIHATVRQGTVGSIARLILTSVRALLACMVGCVMTVYQYTVVSAHRGGVGRDARWALLNVLPFRA